MTNLPSWVGRVTTTWVAIGSLLIVLGAQGVNVPDIISGIFSQDFVDAAIQVIGAVLTFAQFIRGIFASQPPADGKVQLLSTGQKRTFALNPFKFNV